MSLQFNMETAEQTQLRRLQTLGKQNENLQSLKTIKQVISTVNSSSTQDEESKKQKLNQLVLAKVMKYSSLATPILQRLGNELGIQDLISQNAKLPDICPPKDILDKVLKIRNSINSQLTSTSKYVNTTKDGLSKLQKILDTNIKLINTLGNVKKVAQTAKSAGIIAQGLLPILPGAVASTIDIADTTILRVDDITRTLTQSKIYNEPKLKIIQEKLSLGLQYVSQASAVLLVTVIMIRNLDKVLIKCGQQPDSLDPDTISVIASAQQTQQSEGSENYKGFTFKTETKKYTETVNQIRAIATNDQGIELLSTPYSFTTQPQFLFQELKFKIDSENLKPY
jgi:hypothetical protein